MGEFDVLAVAVAVGGLVIGLTHFARWWVQRKIARLNEANNKLLAELVKEVQGLREDLKSGKSP